MSLLRFICRFTGRHKWDKQAPFVCKRCGYTDERKRKKFWKSLERKSGEGKK